jgi:uncharacterized membrane protein YbhN (UPF0104 family)
MPAGAKIMKRAQSLAHHRRIIPAIRTTIAVLAVALSVIAVATRWHEFSADLGRVGLTRTLVSAACMLAGLFAGMLAWRRILTGLGSPLPVAIAGRIFFIGQLGKYVPGSLWPFLAQMELGRDHQIPRRRSVVALVIAVITSLATGLALAGLSVPLLPAHYRALLWWLVLPVPLLVALLHPRVLWAVLRRIPRLRLTDGIDRPQLSTMFRASAWSVAGWLLFGLHIAILVLAFHSQHVTVVLALSVGGYAMAWCAGLVVFVLPAGAGARDLALVAALSGVIQAREALAVAVITRVVTTFCDLSLAGIAMLGARQVLRSSNSLTAPDQQDDLIAV